MIPFLRLCTKSMQVFSISLACQDVLTIKKCTDTVSLSIMPCPFSTSKIYIMPHTVHHVLLDVYHLARIKANHQLFKWTCSLVYHLAIAPISIKNFSHPLLPLGCVSPSIAGRCARRWTSFAVLALYFFLFFLCCRGARKCCYGALCSLLLWRIGCNPFSSWKQENT